MRKGVLEKIIFACEFHVCLPPGPQSVNEGEENHWKKQHRMMVNVFMRILVDFVIFWLLPRSRTYSHHVYPSLQKS